MAATVQKYSVKEASPWHFLIYARRDETLTDVYVLVVLPYGPQPFHLAKEHLCCFRFVSICWCFLFVLKEHIHSLNRSTAPRLLPVWVQGQYAGL